MWSRLRRPRAVEKQFEFLLLSLHCVQCTTDICAGAIVVNSCSPVWRRSQARCRLETCPKSLPRGMCVPRSRTSHLAPLLGDDFGVNSATLVVLEALLLFFANQKTKLGVHTRQMRHFGLSKVSKQSISDNCAHGPKSQPLG